MTSFADFQKNSKSSRLERVLALPALSSFLLCLVLGLVIAGWWANGRSARAHKVAQTEALARAAVIELQLNQAITAAEVLGALARQSGGAIPNFQKVATELRAAHPGVASLELQPGGIVSEVVPHAARRIGVNVLNDPVQRPGVQAAFQKRALTVTGPLTLSDGQPGIVVRVPVVQRGRDGRDVFWGLLAVSMRFSEALAPAKLDDLAQRGYKYVFFATSPATQKTNGIRVIGNASYDGAVRVRAQDLELGLAVQPQTTWASLLKTLLAFLGVFAISGLVCLLVNTLKSRSVVEEALADKTRRLAREAIDREQAQENLRDAKQQVATAHAELKKTQSTLQANEAQITELQNRLDLLSSSALSAETAAQEKLKEAELSASKLQARLETVQGKFNETAQSATELQTRLETTQAKLKEAELSASDLQLNASLLKKQLDAVTRASTEAAAANAAKQKELDASNHELKMRRLAAEQADAQIAELAVLLQKAQAKMQKLEAVPAPNPVLPPKKEKEYEDLAPWETPETAETKLAPVTPVAPVEGVRPSSGAATREVEKSLENFVPPAEFVSEAAVAVVPETPGTPPVESSPTPIDNASATTSATPEVTPTASAVGELLPVTEPLAPDPEPKTKRKPVKVRMVNRKKPNEEATVDLFAAPALADTPAKEAPPAQSEKPPIEEPSLFALSAPDQAQPKQDETKQVPRKERRSKALGQQASLLPSDPEPVTSTASAPEVVKTPEPVAQLKLESEPVAAVPDLPEIEGVSISDGLAHVYGDPGFYLEALREFADAQAGTPAKIRDALVQGDSATAERAVQTLKTAAAEVGATTVSSAAAALDRTIREHSDPSEIEFVWAELEKVLSNLVAEIRALSKPKKDKPAHASRTPSPVNPAQLRKAMNQIVPLFAGQDPGAIDCFQDNCATFQSAFSPEAYSEFEQSVKLSDFNAALEHLKKAAKKHGVSV